MRHDCHHDYPAGDVRAVAYGKVKPTVCLAVPVRMAAHPKGPSRRHGSTGVARDGGAVFWWAKAFDSTLGNCWALRRYRTIKLSMRGTCAGFSANKQYEMDL